MKEYEYKLRIAKEYEDDNKLLHALQVYLQLLEIEEAKRIASIRIALLYEKMERLDKTFEILDRYLADNFMDEEIRKFYGHFLIRQSQYQKAIEVLAGVSTEKNCEVFFLVGLSNYHLGEYKIAQINFESLLKCNPGSELLPETYLYLAKISSKKNSFDSALEYAKKSESFVSQNYEVHFIQAVIYYKKEMYFHALDAIKRALVLNKDEITLNEWAGKIFYKLGEYQKAQEHLKEFVMAVQPTAEVYSLLGMAYHNTNNFKDAQKCFNKALKIDPSNQLAKEGIERISNK